MLGNLDTIIDVVKPAFTRKKIEAVPNQTELLNQQISELQAASSNNAEQIKELAAQLKQMVTALEEAALNVAAERKKTRILSVIAVTVSVIAIITATASFLA
ncbi:MAG: hypothetical protein OEM48_08680 [Gammaproteobacteria bacterium]|nr:hypothetical protein [Gammaproteobacteria bacterium]MDH3406983.1 hypothetical protein [Gammaproteobacteria bacterium]MDH5487636.1 hypothetical protein [Gammaproteobacteria bacterium]